MIYADPINDTLASGEFYDTLGDSFYLSADKLESDYAPVRFERELRIFQAHCRQGAVLDVGCSTGAFLHRLTMSCADRYEVAGMDVSTPALSYTESRGIEVICGSFLDHDFGERRFDAVTFWAVLEHVVFPKHFLNKASSVLKPGGFCFALVPNMRSLAVRLLGPKYRYIMPEHINYFTTATLRALVKTEPAFALAALRSTHFNPLVILQDWRKRSTRVADAERARLLKRTTTYKQNSLLKPLQVAYAAGERLLGRVMLADNLVAVLQQRSSD
jgi:2-polyprenyl-3-methyl-5-hydroxy-6-metoxy-1,4-benzoquinol methylase